MNFRDDFIWGAASASYQVEGAAFQDGRGLSVWDMMCCKPNAIHNAQNGTIACDHYNRYKDDVAIMREIGLKAYRFSISWPRLMPKGTGSVNPKALAFYHDLIDELLTADIVPFVTLFHWDYPQELYCRGGWLNPDSSAWFAEYTAAVIDNFSDKVHNWITLNEPQCFIGLGHSEGIHAPGDKLNLKEVLRAGHNALLSHGKAVQVIRARSKSPARIGYAPVGDVRIPYCECAQDIDAARKSMFSVPEQGLESKVWNNSWWMDPVFLGRYPEDGIELYEAKQIMPRVGSDDLKIISTPIDFCGSNIYHGRWIKADLNGNPEMIKFYDGYPYTAYGWPVIPEALYWGPKFLYERYQKPIIITENGMCCIDWVSLDGKVHDPQRIDFLSRYLAQLKRAARDGVNIAGYFQWSLTDNFEWACGYSQRFGLVHVDYRDQKRTLKDSAYWYKDMILSNGKNL